VSEGLKYKFFLFLQYAMEELSGRDWFLGTLLVCLKEFCAVGFQMVCYSRLGSFDFFTGPLVLYVTLVVFNFPFLNPYLFAFFRFGPWLKEQKGSMYHFYVFIQVVFVSGSQLSGAYVASFITKDYLAKWGKDIGFLNSNLTKVDAGVMYKSLDNGLDSGSVGYLFAEELVSVVVLLVGVIHILEGSLPKLLDVWMSIERSESYNPEDKPPNNPVETSSVPKIDKGPPVPSDFILHVCILVAGIIRAFPSAHQAMHITVYLIAMEYENVSPGGYRVFGGLVATLLCTGYYRWVFRPHSPDALTSKLLNRARIPAYLYAKLTKEDLVRNSNAMFKT